MADLDPLSSLASWKSTSAGERAAILAALARNLGAPWRPGATDVGRHGLGELVHDGTGLAFVVVPGGWLRIGFSCDDLFVGATLRTDGSERLPWGNIWGARPTRWVRMRPYLLARSGVLTEPGERGSDNNAASEAYREAVKAAKGEVDDEEDEDDDADDDDADDADADSDDASASAEPTMRLISADQIAELIPDGFRLPTEAEMEWAFREGGTTRWIGVAGDAELTAANRSAVLCGDLVNGFGLVGFRDLYTPCADGAGWYPGESPTDQRAWNVDADQRIERHGHTYWQDDDGEMMGMHAAARAAPDEYGDMILRLAHDLPLADEPVGEPPGPLVEHAQTLAALAGDDARRRADALVALGYLAQGPGHDVAGTAIAVIEQLDAVAPAVRARLLGWLADAGVGGCYDETVQPPERKRPEAFPDRAATRAAIAARAAAIARHLDDADPDVRSAAALALTFCPATREVAAPALSARFANEPELGVQAAIVLALARLGARFPAPGADPVLRAAVAIGTAFDGPPDLDTLVAATGLSKVPHLAFARGELGNTAIGLVGKLGDADARGRAALEMAARALRDAEPPLADAALKMAFHDARAPGRPWLVDELSAAQRELVERIVALDDGVDWFGAGLPPTASGRRRFLALAVEGPSDRRVTYQGHTRPLYFALRDLAWRIADGDEAAEPERAAILDALSPAARLAVYLDRQAHGLATWVRASATATPPLPDDWDLVDLLAALPDDRREARDEIDALVAAADRPRGGVALVNAVVASRAPGEAVDPALLAELDGDDFGHQDAPLAAFPAADVEAKLLYLLRAPFARALAEDGWQIGVDSRCEVWARALAVAPSATAARQLLILGWASGQPANVREAVATHGGAHPAIAAVLAEYDALGEFTSWPKARKGLAGFGAVAP